MCLLITWLFSTALVVNGKHNSETAFIIKSIFFWIAVIIAYSIGYLIAK